MPTPTERWKQSFHGYLIRLLNSSGYQVSGGVCNGFVLTGILSFLSRELLTFREQYNQIEHFRKNNPDELVARLKSISEKIAHHIKIQSDRDTALIPFTDAEKELKYIRAFLESIVISQAPFQYRGWFNQKTIQQFQGVDINRVVFPESGVTSEFLSVNMYTTEELQQFIDKLNILVQIKGISIALQLHAGLHSIGLLYDHEAKLWIFLDANLPLHPSTPIKNLGQIIKGALHGFKNIDQANMVGFHAYIYGSTHDQQKLESLVHELKESEEYKQSHSLSLAKLSFATEFQESLICLAVGCNNSQILREAFKLGVDLDIQTALTTPLVCAAAEFGFTEMLQTLSDLGADLDKTNNRGLSPASVATYFNHPHVVRLLHRLGADLKKTDLHENTLAIIAAQKNSLETMGVLIELQCDVHGGNKYGHTPLYRAAEVNHPEMILVLHGADADIDAADNNGATPLFIAALEGNIGAVEVLCELKADLNKESDEKTSPIFAACQNGHVEIMRILHRFGADLSKPDSRGFTLAYLAAQTGHVDVIHFLYKAGVDVNATISLGVAPAYVAVFTGSLHALKTLVNYGADLWTPVGGQTLLELAKEMGHEDIVLYIANCSVQRTESLTSLPTFFSKTELSPKNDVNSAEEITVIQGDNPTPS